MDKARGIAGDAVAGRHALERRCLAMVDLDVAAAHALLDVIERGDRDPEPGFVHVRSVMTDEPSVGRVRRGRTQTNG